MGEKYALTEDEIARYKHIICSQLKKWKTLKESSALALFLIWLYEFAEAMSVNKTLQQAKLKTVKMCYSDNDFISRLFRMRGKLVHRCYTIDESLLIKFYDDNELQIVHLMGELGFDNISDISPTIAPNPMMI